MTPVNVPEKDAVPSATGSLGGSLYLGLVWLMRLPEVELILAKIGTRLRRKT